MVVYYIDTKYTDFMTKNGSFLLRKIKLINKQCFNKSVRLEYNIQYMNYIILLSLQQFFFF